MLSWITRAKQPHSVDDLVARGKYQKAIDVMRKEFAVRFPSAAERLRFADVLVLAGRGAEAMPVLLGVADEQERYGFRDKALEALRRAEEIAPGSAEVADHLERIRSEPASEADTSGETPGGDEPGNVEDAIDTAFAASTGPGEGGEAVSSADERPLLTEEELEDDIRADAQALLSGKGPEPGPQRALLTEEELEDDIQSDARALLSGKGPEPGPQRALLTEEELEDDIQSDARALLSDERADADGPLILDIEAELEKDREADARALLASGPATWEGSDPLLADAASDPGGPTATGRDDGGDSNGSPQGRLRLARAMLDVGRDDDALAILAEVAEELARHGQAQKAIAILKKVERIQQRGIHEVCLTPLTGRRRKAARRARAAAAEPPPAMKEAAFREWVGSVLRETADLADRAAGSVEEGAEGDGEPGRDQLSGESAQPRVHGLRGQAGGHQRRHEHAG
jgi:tetratricopeptide (TPR) repeat protein